MLVLVCAMCLGCGKKGPPRPPDTQPPPPACSFTGENVEGKARLTWNQSGCVAGGESDGFKVFMAREKSEKDACRNCPMNFQLVATVHVGKFNPWQTTPDKAVHVEPIQDGYRYVFKVVAFGPGGDSQDSERVTVETVSP